MMSKKPLYAPEMYSFYYNLSKNFRSTLSQPERAALDEWQVRMDASQLTVINDLVRPITIPYPLYRRGKPWSDRLSSWSLIDLEEFQGDLYCIREPGTVLAVPVGIEQKDGCEYEFLVSPLSNVEVVRLDTSICDRAL